MIRGLGQIIPCAPVLGVQQGEVAGQLDVVQHVDPAGQLQTLDTGLLDVEVGHHGRTVARAPLIALDQILDLVVEAGHPGAEARGLVGGAQLVADGGFRLQVRVADDLAGAAAGGGGEAFAGLGQGRGLERLAGATLDHPLVGQGVEGVGARAELGAIGLVVIQTTGEGQGQIAEAELVLQVDGALGRIHAAIGDVAAVLQLGLAQLGA
ncbi:hypothetical protein D3C84_470830 [compost metagenome]